MGYCYANEPAISGAPGTARHNVGNLVAVDLNLLVALDALLAYRNVTHAARRLGQTQPAVSRSLGRLRELLADDILVRGSSGMKLTARGEYLAQIVPPTMSHVRDVVSSRHIDPIIKVAVDGNLMPALFSHFLHSIAQSNEMVKLDAYKTVDSGVHHLMSASADFMLGTTPAKYSGLQSKHVLHADFVTLVCVDHLKQESMRSQQTAFRDSNHIRIVENGVEIFPEFTEAMSVYGESGARFMEVSDVTSAALVVSKSDFALTVPKFVAAWLMRMVPLSVIQPPVNIRPQEISLSWMAGVSEDDNNRLIEDICSKTRLVLTNDCNSLDFCTPRREYA